MQNFLCNRFQKTEVNEWFSNLKEVLAEVPGVSIFATLLINVFVNKSFSDSNLCNDTEAKTLHLIN